MLSELLHTTVNDAIIGLCLFVIGRILFGLKKSLFFSKIFNVSSSSTSYSSSSNGGVVPPGNMGWPLIGQTLAFLNPHPSNSIGNFLHHHLSRYGGVFKCNVFGRPTIVSCDSGLNAFVMQNEGRLFSSSYPKPVRDILGNGSMLLVHGDVHKKLRSVGINFINASKSSPDFLSYIEKSSMRMMDHWKDDGSPILFHKEAKQLTFYIILKNALDMERGEEHVQELLNDFLTFMEGFVSLPLNLPWTAYGKAIKAKARVCSTIRRILNERKQKGSIIMKGELMEEIMEKWKLNEEEKVNIVFDLLLAGYETTSAVIALVVYFLACSPSALHQLKEEHQLLRNKKGGEPLNLEDYKQMEFTSKVLNESLRCGNVVKFVHREALEDVRYKDIAIPKGWQVLPVLSATNLNQSFHENPSEFNPWRWDDEATGKKVTPFGGGIRLCPGAELAKVETAFFLHHLILNFRWKIKAADECPMSYPFLEFKRGLLLEVERAASGY